MSTINHIFLAISVLSLALVLICSKVTRAIVWESLRHPFTRSRIELHNGQLKIWRAAPQGDNESGRDGASPTARDETPEWKETSRG